MAFKYTCDICGEEMMDDNRNDLIDAVQAHAESEHDAEMSRSDIGRDIEEE